ncbi:MAG: metallopeptidase TldD-related protein, partial [Burkholderiales bacterium]|nr:metallopeptidase TldD-related protein [Burkholderiales bacterium]
KQDIEILENTHDRSLAVQVYIGQATGCASSGDMSDEGIRSAVKAALNIAKYTAEDPCAGLPEKELLCQDPPDLSLCHPWNISTEEAVDICKKAEKAGLDADKRVTNTEGASFTTSTGTFVLGNTLGFCNGYPFSSHTVGVGLIAEDENGMQTGGWYSSDTVPEKLEDPQKIGRKAAERACSMLSAKSLDTRKCPMIFENRAAEQILGVLRSAASGGALYRKASFLLDKKGSQIFPEYVSVLEDPY